MKRIDSLKSLRIEKSVLDKVSVRFAWHYKFVPFKIEGNLLTIVVSRPLDVKTCDEIRLHLGYDLEVISSSEEEVLEAIRRNYGLAAETIDGLLSQGEFPSEGDSAQEERAEAEDVEKLSEDASVINLVNQIFLEAYKKRATDIHIEPYRQKLKLRYRIDGVLYQTKVPPQMKQFLMPILSRIKIMANLNIVERRLPQDGRAIVKIQGHKLDLRVSTIPTTYGESVVVRLLPEAMLFNLKSLGLKEKESQILESLITRPHGIIFLTGPTGSGKTTTLYTALNQINTDERKIITVEDPIEYEVEGMTQIQVNSAIGLTFSQVLRNILRHDPDVVMVGETRDLETAEIAIRLALTGHLVFSTLHTNDAPSGAARLLDIGLEPYLVASSVEAFIAQRLVRAICPECKEKDLEQPTQIISQIRQEAGIDKEVTIYKGKGCEACNFTGFKGRVGIYEILLVDSSIRELILNKASSDEIRAKALSIGMKTLRQDGWNKVIEGITTPGEIMKVTPSQEVPVQTGFESKQEGVPVYPEKRIFKRLDKRFSLRYREFSPQEVNQRAKEVGENITLGRNLSASGVLFESSQVLTVGSTLEMTIELPNEENPITCLAKVIRAEILRGLEVYEIGVCFLDISGADRKRLDSKIASLQESLEDKIKPKGLIPSPSERRVFPRLDKKIPIHYRLFSSQESTELLSKVVFTKNLSAGGILFEASQSLTVGSILEVTIELPKQEEPIICLVRVIRVSLPQKLDIYDTAIIFLDISSADRQKLSKYIHQQEKS
ncbi:MAG: ATPase, T2SS/T4P/T4SS family [Candidatus Omnitrophota bacterium]